MGPVRQNPIQRTVSLFICVCIALCTIVAHNIAQNRPDSSPPYPPDNHHCSDDVYLREGGMDRTEISKIRWIHWFLSPKEQNAKLRELMRLNLSVWGLRMVDSGEERWKQRWHWLDQKLYNNGGTWISEGMSTGSDSVKGDMKFW